LVLLEGRKYPSFIPILQGFVWKYPSFIHLILKTGLVLPNEYATFDGGRSISYRFFEKLKGRAGTNRDK
jgi:hypothetical protein